MAPDIRVVRVGSSKVKGVGATARSLSVALRVLALTRALRASGFKADENTADMSNRATKRQEQLLVVGNKAYLSRDTSMPQDLGL